MAPWNRLRPDRQSEKDLKKRSSTYNRPPSRSDSPPPSDDAAPEAPRLRGESQPPPVSPRRNHRTRDSVVSLSAVNDAFKSRAEPPPPPRVPLLEVPEIEANVRPQRFSLLRFRHASDSQLSKTAQTQASPPPIPLAPPSIITTAPTDNVETYKRRSTFSLARRSRAIPRQRSHGELQAERDAQATPVPPGKPSSEGNGRLRVAPLAPAPPPYGDESSSMLALPASRVSESSRSDASSVDHRLYAQTTTTHTVSTTTTFFRLGRRKRDKGPLFPLPPKTNSNLSSLTNTPRMSSARDSESPVRPSFTEGEESGQQSPVRAPLNREDSRTSGTSLASLGRPPKLEQRGRSSTLSSLRKRMAEDDPLPTPPLPVSARTSTSTTGRPSLGGLLNAGRRQHDGLGLRNLRSGGDPGTPASFDSKQNSFNLPREPAIVIPERQEGDTPAKYLGRLEEVVHAGAMVAILSKSDDEFMRNVLRSFMRRFKFFEDPLDMAIRKLLMHVELPKETQQIDRTLQSFADRYDECNPGIFASADDAYFVAFSILILHTDVFNKNNKHKMTKVDYVKNAQSRGGISPEVLECFYDNIAYTPFIHLEDDGHIAAERVPTPKQSKKAALKAGGTPKRIQSSPVDPYALILDNRLDTLRPALDDILNTDDSFGFMAPSATWNISELNKSFFRSGVIQILSARSRPEAFANQATITNPFEASVGVVDIKVTKVGVLWRKDPKKKKTRSPWQEWGAILTGSQLYFFRNTSWVKNLMSQYDTYYKAHEQGPVVFKPPLEQFKPDFLISLDDAVALIDARYKKHKNAFLFTRQDTFAEVLLADNETEFRDWLAKINYAAAFRSAGVRMRGAPALHEAAKSLDAARAISRGSNGSTVQSDELSRPSTRPDELTEEQQIIIARRQIIAQKIQEADARVRGIEKAIESQLRNGRHLKLLTPIQQRTREDVEIAAIQLADILRTTQVAKWRIRCYRKVLAMDLEDDLDGQKQRDHGMDGESKDMTQQNSRDSDRGRLGFGRLASKNSGSSAQGKNRPTAQPNSQKLFSMDEIFRTPSRLRAQGIRSKAVWELPPINFDRRKSTSQTRQPKEIEETVLEDTEGESLKTSSIKREGVWRTSSEFAVRLDSFDPEEREVLAQSGVDPDRISVPTEKEKGSKASEADEAPKMGSPDDKESRAKARHSFQRKLQASHGPSHQRSRKGKDSASTITGLDDISSSNAPQHLARTGTRFTLHGKKASVVTFGTEWQNIAPEDRLLPRHLPHEAAASEATESVDGESAVPESEATDILSPNSRFSDLVRSPSFKSARSSFEEDSLSDGEVSPRAVDPPHQSIEAMLVKPAKDASSDDEAPKQEEGHETAKPPPGDSTSETSETPGESTRAGLA